MTKKYKAVIFDCDGVLVETEVVTNTVLQEMMAENGIEMSLPEVVKKYSGVALDLLIDELEERAEGDFDRGKFVEDFRRRSFEKFEEEVAAVPGVFECLDWLDEEEIKYCVASSGPMEKMAITLRSAGLWEKIEGRIFSAYVIQKWKPDPAVFLWAAEEMRLNPEDCLVVEDSGSGIKAARAGGFDVVGFQHELNSEYIGEFGVDVISDMRDLRNKF